MPSPSRFRLWRRLILSTIALAWAGTAYYQAHKPMPEGTSVASKWYDVPSAKVTFIADITAADAYGRPVVSQAIFDEILRTIRSARQLIVLDYFLFNDWHGSVATPGAPLRAISAELRDALIAQRQAHPDLKVLFITDPINEVYGSERRGHGSGSIARFESYLLGIVAPRDPLVGWQRTGHRLAPQPAR
jgi:hypothetical protein